MAQIKPKTQTSTKVPVKRVKQMVDSLTRESNRKTVGAYQALKGGDTKSFDYGTKSALADRNRADRLNKIVNKATSKPKK